MKNHEDVAELICELTRSCNVKEEYFAASFNLSPTEIRLLKLFVFSKSFSIREIIDKLNLTPGRITHILTSLEQKKLLTRKQDPNDRRTVIVSLLPKASPLIQNIHQSYTSLNENLFQTLSTEELVSIRNSLQILVRKITEWVDSK